MPDPHDLLAPPPELPPGERLAYLVELTDDELVAVVAHEHALRAHRHRPRGADQACELDRLEQVYRTWREMAGAAAAALHRWRAGGPGRGLARDVARLERRLRRLHRRLDHLLGLVADLRRRAVAPAAGELAGVVDAFLAGPPPP